MTSTTTFITVGNYLAAPILVSAGMTVMGLTIWGQSSGSFSDSMKPKGSGVAMQIRRPVGPAVVVIGVTHVVGAILYKFVTQLDPTAVSYVCIFT